MSTIDRPQVSFFGGGRVEVPERGSSPKVEVVTGGWVTSRFYRLLVIANLMLPAPVFGFDWF